MVTMLDVAGLDVASPGQTAINCSVPKTPKLMCAVNTPFVRVSFLEWSKIGELIE